MEKQCFFIDLYSCSKCKDPLSEAGAERIIKASKQYKDELCAELEEQYESEKALTVPVHRKCIDKYCHKKNIQKALRSNERLLPSTSCSQELATDVKRARRSEHLKFIALLHCIFCGEMCEVHKDPKNPSRWREAYICRQGEVEGRTNLKEEVIKTCDRRNDVESEKVRVRIAGIPSDLHAADIRYQVDCKARFMTEKPIQAAARQSNYSKEEPSDYALISVMKHLSENKTNMYNSIDIYQKYVDAGGESLSRRQVMTNIVEEFGDDLVVLSSPGLANIVLFKSHSAKFT